MNSFNRYLVFAGANGSHGGFDDFIASFRELQHAMKFVDTIHYVGKNKEPAEWCQIVDMNRMEILVRLARSCDVKDGKFEWNRWEEVSEY